MPTDMPMADRQPLQPSSSHKLDEFIAAAKAQGASDESLAVMLKEHGWPAKEVYSAFGRFYERQTGLPIPSAAGQMESAREAFFYLLAFLTLSCWAVAVGAIWFARIDQWFDDPLDYYYRRDLTFPIASILVAFPAYLLAMRSVLREQAQHPEKKESGVRRWLTNWALLITALILIGDLTYFLARFLGGGLSMAFVLKSLVVSIIAGGIFWYYTAAVARRRERAG
jgi:hypothetical protein